MTTPDTTIQPVDEPVLLTPEQLVEELKAADIVTVDLINETKAAPVALQSAELEAAHTFKTIKGYLSTLRAAYENVVIDTTTNAGLEFAKQARFKLKTLRTRSDKLRLESNEPFAGRIQAHNDAQKMIEDAIRPLEQRFDEAIKAQERVAAQRKADEEAAAALKAANITAAINGIAAMADDAIDMTAAQIAVRIQEVTLHDLSEEELGARFGEAVAIKDRTVAKLEAAHAKAITNEANALQVEEDRKLHAQERADRELREAAERDAREAIDRINAMLAAAGTKTPDQLADDIDGLEGIIFEQYQPLETDARAAVDRTLPVLRQTRADKIAAAEKLVRDTEAAAKREKEESARTRIAAMKATVADAVGASSATISASIEAVDGLLLESFEPFTKEAEEEQGRVLTALEKLRANAAADERTAAEKQAEADRLAAEQRATAERNQQIADRIARIEGIAARTAANGAGSQAISGLIEELNGAFTEELYGGRAQEASDLSGDEVVALRALFETVKAEEDTAAREQAEREAELEVERKKEARRSSIERVLAANMADIYLTLEAVLKDEGFGNLSKDAQAKVIRVCATVTEAAKD